MDMVLGSRIVDISSIVIGTHYLDPEASEVWYGFARFMDGTPLTWHELEELYVRYPIDEDMVERYGM